MKLTHPVSILSLMQLRLLKLGLVHTSVIIISDIHRLSSVLLISSTCLLSHLGDKCVTESAYDAYDYDYDVSVNQALCNKTKELSRSVDLLLVRKNTSSHILLTHIIVPTKEFTLHYYKHI